LRESLFQQWFYLGRLMRGQAVKSKNILIFLIVVLCFTSFVHSQDDDDLTPKLSPDRTLKRESFYKRSQVKTDQFQQTVDEQQQQLDLVVVPLEKPIDPNEYVVGPGDLLGINIGHEISSMFEVQITPEGKLLIPALNPVDVQGLTLTQAKEKISEAMKAKYLNRDITVSLIRLRRFRVTVSGQVTQPGNVIVTAADRVSDAIRLANPPEEEKENVTDSQIYSGRTGAVQVEAEKLHSKRHIVLTRLNDQKMLVDLLGFEVTGDKRKNPLLREGDVIFAPLLSKNQPMAGVYGAVHNPNIYEFMEGDCVMDLINLAHGFMCNADPSNIEIVRFNPDNKTTYSFKVDLSDAVYGNGDVKNNFPLQIDDRIFVRYHPEYRIRRQIQIKGEIMYPGDYPIELNKTRLSEVIKAAGGFTENASLKEAFVIRRLYEYEVDPEYERLSQTRIDYMTDLERAYYTQKNRERPGLVAVDFIGLFVHNDTTKDIILQNKDYIEIPPKDEVVNVMGQVVRPGYIAFKKGQSLSYYINKAGGYSTNVQKRKIRIIRAETGVWEKPKRNTIINIGDTIFIPEKPEPDYWQVFKDVLSATVQIATLVLVIQNASK